MDRKVKKYLYDILVCIEGVETHIGERKVYEEFSKNRTVKMAVERELIIIGEAMRNVLLLVPDIKIENAKKVIGARNILAHEYDSVDDITIWAIIINHLPKLKIEVQNLINQ